MGEKEMVVIQNEDDTTMEVELVTYLVSDDKTNCYLVYSKGEKMGDDGDEVIYISKIAKEGEILKIVDIADDNEWNEVQKMLKKIANA